MAVTREFQIVWLFAGGRCETSKDVICSCIKNVLFNFAVKVNEGAGTEDANEGIEFQYGEDSEDDDVDTIDQVSSAVLRLQRKFHFIFFYFMFLKHSNPIN